LSRESKVIIVKESSDDVYTRVLWGKVLRQVVLTRNYDKSLLVKMLDSKEPVLINQKNPRKGNSIYLLTAYGSGNKSVLPCIYPSIEIIAEVHGDLEVRDLLNKFGKLSLDEGLDKATYEDLFSKEIFTFYPRKSEPMLDNLTSELV